MYQWRPCDPVANRYNTYKFDGAKHVVLSTTSWHGYPDTSYFSS